MKNHENHCFVVIFCNSFENGENFKIIFNYYQKLISKFFFIYIGKGQCTKVVDIYKQLSKMCKLSYKKMFTKDMKECTQSNPNKFWKLFNEFDKKQLNFNYLIE